METKTNAAPAGDSSPAPCSPFSGEIPPELRAKMEADRADAEAGLWWMIEHPENNGLYWDGGNWTYELEEATQYTTRGHAEYECRLHPALESGTWRITQHGPAIDKPNAEVSRPA